MVSLGIFEYLLEYLNVDEDEVIVRIVLDILEIILSVGDEKINEKVSKYDFLISKIKRFANKFDKGVVCLGYIWLYGTKK